MKNRIFEVSKSLQDRMQNHADYLWNNAECGFELDKTVAYVKKQLLRIGIEAQDCGKCGISAMIDGKSKTKSDKTFLLRADMDALRGVDSTKPEQCMHACGHHYHTAMLLGAAEGLVELQDELNGNVKLMFQGAEEILSGADDMIKNGVLEHPKPDGAFMLHVMSGVELPMGNLVVSSGGVSAPAAHFFEIEIIGKGTHGAMPHKGVDAVSTSAYIMTALHEINARELPIGEPAAITVGRVVGGKSANVLPDKVMLWGSLRAFDLGTAENLKKRVCEICEHIAAAMRAEAKVTFTHGCPTLINDEELSKMTFEAFKDIFGEDKVMISGLGKELYMSGGSDDFSYVSQRVPSLIVSVCAGSIKDGFEYPLHNPKTSFDDRALSIGAAAYMGGAIAFFKNKAR